MLYNCLMVPETRYTRSTVGGVPKQSRPNLVLKAGRFDPDKWERLEAICQELGINPSDALREGVDLFLEKHGRG